MSRKSIAHCARSFVPYIKDLGLLHLSNKRFLLLLARIRKCLGLGAGVLWVHPSRTMVDVPTGHK